MLMPPIKIMNKIDWSDPDNPKLKSKVSKEEKEIFQNFIQELKENGEIHKTDNGFEAEHY
ncbi:hypothetical protein [Limosilactobacillus reuteri]|uniref:hypothetical protein n=1 Tax=Limosilactobacillus reuteri TaxID=1598 RepID=UPI001E44B81C|nr:hypothetical protein [Limosilactobacillus reuteri]